MKRLILTLAVAGALLPTPVAATHDAGFHWPHSSRTFTLDVMDCTGWPEVAETIGDWHLQANIDLRTVPCTVGMSTSECWADRTITVCAGSAGTWWQGRAWNQPSSGHTTRAQVYFNMDKIHSGTNRLALACHELGHTFGLGHPDPNHPSAADSGCMHNADVHRPGPHDFAQIAAIHDHADGCGWCAPTDSDPIVGQPWTKDDRDDGGSNGGGGDGDVGVNICILGLCL